MKTIVVIGAGVGGLYAAEKLSSAGHKVLVIEARQRADLGYPWYDSVNPSTFRSVGLQLPDGICIPKQVLQYRSPSGKGKIKQPDRANRSLDVHRKKFIEFLINRADRCEFHYGERVTDLIVEEDYVKGVRTERGEYPADLVIDSAGAYSPIRQKTPDRLLVNDPVREGDCITAFREMYSSKGDSTAIKPNVYLYPVGLMLAWSKSEPDWKGADVFMGSYQEIDQEKKSEALAFLRDHEPCLGEELLCSFSERIPLRYPLAVLAGNGYAAVGNSAFMTRPFCGSGIETALKAARDLAAVVESLKDKPCSAENLWKYTLRFNRKFGANFSAQYVFRQVIENLPPEDLDFLFTSGLFDKGVVALATLDRKNIKGIEWSAFFHGFLSAWRRKDITAMVKTAVGQATRAYLLARSLPSRYDYAKVKEWKTAFDAFMRNAPDVIQNSRHAEDRD